LIPPKETIKVLADVAEERLRQDLKFGDQSHLPDLCPLIVPEGVAGSWDELPEIVAADYSIASANEARERCSHAFQHGRGNLADVLIEEVCEAIEQAALGDPLALREELLQVAAVAALWVEILDKRPGIK
jgi:hypothetical protein